MIVKFSSLPSDVQTAVMWKVRENAKSEAEHRMRYFKDNGFSSAYEYYNHLRTTLKPSTEDVKYFIQAVALEQYKSAKGVMPIWAADVPALCKYCTENHMPSHC
jgi:hypothetical protein